MLKKLELFKRISFIFLIMISTKELKCFKCGSDKLTKNPGILNTTKDYSKRKLYTEYTNIKIIVDYSNFHQSSDMDSNTYNKIKNLIEETINEFTKFIKVQHINIDLTNGRSLIKDECQLT